MCIFLDSLTVVSAATFLNKFIFVSQSEVDHEFKTITFSPLEGAGVCFF